MGYKDERWKKAPGYCVECGRKVPLDKSGVCEDCYNKVPESHRDKDWEENQGGTR